MGNFFYLFFSGVSKIDIFIVNTVIFRIKKMLGLHPFQRFLAQGNLFRIIMTILCFMAHNKYLVISYFA